MYYHSDGNTLRTLKLSICPLLEVCIYIIRIGSKTSVIYREVCFIWKFLYCRHEAALFPVVRKPHSLCCCSASICGISMPEASTMWVDWLREYPCWVEHHPLCLSLSLLAQGLWRFWMKGNHILVVGAPYSPYARYVYMCVYTLYFTFRSTNQLTESKVAESCELVCTVRSYV